MTCEPLDVVIVPFPFSDTVQSKRRPALVLSRKPFNQHGHLILAMITTTEHSPWPGDTTLTDYRKAGLHLPCMVRLKLFTLDSRLIRQRIGRLSEPDGALVIRHLRESLG